VPASFGPVLTISVSPEPGYVVVSVAGEIDVATAAQFREQLASVISGGARRVVVDLARVTFMASAGIGVLTGTHRVLAAQSGSLVLASPSPAAGRVLSLAGVDQVIPVTGSVADAVARWASEGVELPETTQFKHADPPRHAGGSPGSGANLGLHVAYGATRLTLGQEQGTSRCLPS
jgi:anti-sigma B factor antagonist